MSEKSLATVLFVLCSSNSCFHDSRFVYELYTTWLDDAVEWLVLKNEVLFLLALFLLLG